MEPDRGTDANVMDEYQYETMRRKIEGNIDLKRCITKLSTLQNDLPVSGVFNALLRNTAQRTETSIIVVKRKINSPPLLGKKMELGMLEKRPDDSLKAEKGLGIRKNIAVNAVRSRKPIPEIQTILEQFDEVFQGIGKIFDKKKNTDFLVKFSMKSGAVPVAQKPRPVPYYLQEPLRK